MKTINRVVCINCMDGRTQIPVIDWIKENYNVEFVDVITKPGPDGILSQEGSDITSIIDMLKISLKANSSAMIFTVGHHDCKGNPVPDSQHKEQIETSVKRLQESFRQVPIVGLWVNSDWNVEKISA